MYSLAQFFPILRNYKFSSIFKLSHSIRIVSSESESSPIVELHLLPSNFKPAELELIQSEDRFFTGVSKFVTLRIPGYYRRLRQARVSPVRVEGVRQQKRTKLKQLDHNTSTREIRLANWAFRLIFVSPPRIEYLKFRSFLHVSVHKHRGFNGVVDDEQIKCIASRLHWMGKYIYRRIFTVWSLGAT